MTATGKPYDRPVCRPVGDCAVMVEFGDSISDATHNAVLGLDASLDAVPIAGALERTPAYTTLLIQYDPLETDFGAIRDAVKDRARNISSIKHEPMTWDIPTCYSAPFAPDLDEVSDRLGVSPEDIIQQHSETVFKVYMYGFAPGFAYMGSNPNSIQLPRRATPITDVPIGSVLIAGPQCLITTLDMPTGWWIIGQASKTPLQADTDTPFLFKVGDHVKFSPVDEHAFHDLAAAEGAKP